MNCSRTTGQRNTFCFVFQNQIKSGFEFPLRRVREKSITPILSRLSQSPPWSPTVAHEAPIHFLPYRAAPPAGASPPRRHRSSADRREQSSLPTFRLLPSWRAGMGLGPWPPQPPWSLRSFPSTEGQRFENSKQKPLTLPPAG